MGVFLDLQFINKPEVMIGNAAERFDADGRLTHEPTRAFLKTMVQALTDRVRFLRDRN